MSSTVGSDEINLVLINPIFVLVKQWRFLLCKLRKVTLIRIFLVFLIQLGKVFFFHGSRQKLESVGVETTDNLIEVAGWISDSKTTKSREIWKKTTQHWMAEV